MTSFMDTYLDAQSNFSNDINLYSEGFRFDEQDMDFIEGQIALREIPILLEKEEIMSRMNLYGEAAGGILVGLLSFIKSAIALMIKIFLGFKGIIIAVVVALIGRFIIKKFRGGSVSYSGGGGGGSASVSMTSGIPATPKHKQHVIQDILSTAAAIDSVPVLTVQNILQNVDLKSLDKPTIEKYVEDVLNSIRIEADDGNTSAVVIPESVKPNQVVAVINKCLREDKRPTGGTYSSVLKSNPYYIFEGDVFKEIQSINNDNSLKMKLEDFIVDTVRNFDSMVTAAYVTQAGVLKALTAYSGSAIEEDYFKMIIDEMKNQIGDTFPDLVKIAGKDIDVGYDAKEDPDEYYAYLLKKMVNRCKPTVASGYIKISDALTKIDKFKTATSIDDAEMNIVSLATDDKGTLIGVSYGKTRTKYVEYSLLTRFQKIFGDNKPDMNRMKSILNKLTELGNYIQKSISKYNVTSSENKVWNTDSSKKAINISLAMTACVAHSVNILSFLLKNSINPINKIIEEDVTFISVCEGIKAKMLEK